MTAKSKARTAVGIVAACAAASSTTPISAAPLSSSSSTSSAAARRASVVVPCDSLSRGGGCSQADSLPNRIIPRGGHSPAASTEKTSSGTATTNNNSTKEGEKRRRKKKKRPKQQQQQQQRANRGDDGASKTGARNSQSENTTENDDDGVGPSRLPPAAQSILSQSCHYDVLGITNAATSVEIQKAYRRRCVLTHPDKTRGDRSAFDKVSEAYEVLSCETKRAVYDRFGKEGLENGMDVNGGANGMRSAGFSGGSFFGNDVFRDLFGGADPFSGRQRQRSPPFRRPPQMPRNRDLRYQLEATLEELYAGATKRVAIQQPDPLRPHFPFRKEVEVTLEPGARGGGSVRLSGVVDSVPDAAPADVVFLVRERRHPVFTRRGNDLAMEVKISFGESIVGFRRKVACLDGRTIEIANPSVERMVTKEEIVDAPALPPVEDNGVTSATTVGANSNSTDVTLNVTSEETPPPEPITKRSTLTYRLPPSIIRTGDVHVLKGHGMPKGGGRDGHGDLYVQYVVETASESTRADADNLSPEERVELARLLSKLDGKGEDPAGHVMVAETGEDDGGGLDGGSNVESSAQFLAEASASDFGSSADPEVDDDDHHHHGPHHDDVNGHMPNGFQGDFFQQAFGGGRSRGFGGQFGGGGGGFRYFSSAGAAGGGYGHGNDGGEEDHRVECNQM